MADLSPSDYTFSLMCRDHLMGLPVQVTPEKRGQAKQMAYGLLYGIGMHALAKSMEVTPDQAQQLSDSFRRRIPTLVGPCMILADSPLPAVPVFGTCLHCQLWHSIVD